MNICGGVYMRILLVEDEKRMAEALCEILRLEKYEVDHYANGLDGLAAIESNIYDIVILDVMLPEMNGSVINKGDEIPTEQREQIFERFYRADTVRNSEDKHYGLGLAIAKAIVTSHKGHIEVQCFEGLVEFKVQIPAK